MGGDLLWNRTGNGDPVGGPAGLRHDPETVNAQGVHQGEMVGGPIGDRATWFRRAAVTTRTVRDHEPDP